MADNGFVSGLNDDELNEFLSELDSDGDSVEFYQRADCAEPKEPKIIIVGNLLAKVNLTPEERAEMMRKTKSTNLAEMRRKIKEIKREYVMSGRSLELSTNIEPNMLKQMISHLTEDLYIKSQDAKNKLTDIIGKELRKFIPVTLKVLYRNNKEAFAVYEGFDYITSPYYGNLKLRIVPDIPKVFLSPTEMEVLRAKCKHRLFTFDKLVERYYDMTKKRVQAEVSLAIKFKKIKTVLDVLDMGLRYYEAYKFVTDNKNNI